MSPPDRDFRSLITELLESGASSIQIAATLTNEGYLTPHGKPWTPDRVKDYRKRRNRAKDDAEASLCQRGARPAHIDDIYPYEVPVGADCYCEPPGLRRRQRQGRW